MNKIRIPCAAPGQRDIEIKEARVIRFFTIDVNGVPETFCVHDSVDDKKEFTVTHYATGRRIKQFAQTVPQAEGIRIATEAVKKAMAENGELWFSMNIAAMERFNHGRPK